MFWFTAIALLAEACALIGDREQAAVLYALLEPHSDRIVQVSQAASFGSAQRFLALLAARPATSTRRRPLRGRRWRTTPRAGCAVVA